MMLICWMRRTGANTWRSFPPLQKIIAIIIVMFYSIFFCCSIWTLIRVCVGLFIPHPSSFTLIQRFNPFPISAHRSVPRSALWTSTVWEMVPMEGGDAENLFTSWIRPLQLPSAHPPLQSIAFSALASSSPVPWSRGCVSLQLILPLAFRFRRAHVALFHGGAQIHRARSENVLAFWGIWRLTAAGFAEKNTFLDVLISCRNFSDKLLHFVLKPLGIL